MLEPAQLQMQPRLEPAVARAIIPVPVPETAVQCRLNYCLTDADVFPAMIKYTNLTGTISRAEWAQRFGTVSRLHPFGEHIWQGMFYELATLYLPLHLPPG